MFLSIPRILVGKPAASFSRREQINYAYANVRSAYGVSTYGDPKWLGGPLPVLQGSASELAADVVSNLLTCADLPYPMALVDCRSATMLDGQAPTYRLATACNLERTTCWSLTGLGGTEFCEALLQVHGLGVTTAAISMTQVIQTPDTRAVLYGYPLGDAVAAAIVTLDPIINEPSWRILGCELQQFNSIEFLEPHHITNLTATVCKSADVSMSAIRWWIAQHTSAVFLDCVNSALPEISGMNVLRSYSEVNFGCADVLTTLASTTSEHSGLGAMIFAGRFGSLGLVLLDD